MICAWDCSFALYAERMRVSALVSPVQVRVSTQCTRCMCKHSHQKEHEIIRPSSDDVQHHMMTFHCCEGFWMMAFMSVLKGV